MGTDISTTIDTVPDPDNPAGFLGYRVTCSACGPLDGLTYSEVGVRLRSEGHLRSHADPAKDGRCPVGRVLHPRGYPRHRSSCQVCQTADTTGA
jgi:hypothetical protein